MLFLGLGTGLGSALVWDKILMPLELGDLPYRERYIIENNLGIPGLALSGEKKMEARSSLRGHSVKKIIHCRLCRSWRRSRAQFQSLARRNRTRAK